MTTIATDGRTIAWDGRIVTQWGLVLMRDAEKVSIGAGTEGRVSGRIQSYFMESNNTVGITVYMGAVQILKLVEYQGGGDDGFDEEEDAFDASSVNSSDESSGNGDDGDF